MEHILFILYSTASVFGIVILVLIVQTFIRYEDNILKRYFVLMLLITAFFLTEVIELYGIAANIESLNPSSFCNIAAYKTLEIAIMVYVPVFVFTLLDGGKKTAAVGIFTGLGLVLMFLLFFSLVTGTAVILDGIEMAFAGWITFWIIFLVFRMRKKLTLRMKRAVLILGLLILVFSPFLVFDIAASRKEGFLFRQELHSVSLSFLVFYLIWNGLNIFLGITYYGLRPDTGTPAVNEAVLDKYGITPREKEIIIQITRGHANKEIAFRLGISSKTAKNHIYNIYKKMGIQSRIELLMTVIRTGQGSKGRR